MPSWGSLPLHSVDVAHLVYHSLLDGHVGAFYLWAVVKGAAVNIPILVLV